MMGNIETKKKKIIDVENLKKIQIRLLDEFDNFCKENDLVYYLTDGTLLGAVRHKGYIPWDDDIDVVMPRDDYELFINRFNQFADGTVKVLSHKLDHDYYMPFAKLVDNRTILKEQGDVDYDIGVYIDIFPLDNLGSDFVTAKKIMKKAFYINRKRVVKTISFSKKRSIVKNLILLFGKMSLLLQSTYSIIDQLDNFCFKNGTNDGSTYVGVLTGISSGNETRVLKKEWFSRTVQVEFEGKKYPAPIGYDMILKHIYGEYMILPPEEKRITHHSYIAWYK